MIELKACSANHIRVDVALIYDVYCNSSSKQFNSTVWQELLSNVMLSATYICKV